MSLLNEPRLFKSFIDKMKLRVLASSEVDDPVFIETATGSDIMRGQQEIVEQLIVLNKSLNELLQHMRVITGERFR